MDTTAEYPNCAMCVGCLCGGTTYMNTITGDRAFCSPKCIERAKQREYERLGLNDTENDLDVWVP